MSIMAICKRCLKVILSCFTKGYLSKFFSSCSHFSCLRNLPTDLHVDVGIFFLKETKVLDEQMEHEQCVQTCDLFLDLILNFWICIPVINSRGLSEVMIASWKYKFIIWNYGSRPMELVKLKVSLLASSAWWSNYEHMQTWTDCSAKCTRPQHRWTSSSL